MKSSKPLLISEELLYPIVSYHMVCRTYVLFYRSKVAEQKSEEVFAFDLSAFSRPLARFCMSNVFDILIIIKVIYLFAAQKMKLRNHQ